MRRILFLLFALLSISSCWAANKLQNTSNEVFPSLWRNTTTGDWEIAFYQDFAIFDCHFWQYKEKKQKGDKYHLLLTDGKKEILVSMDKSKQGNRMMQIGNKRAEYSLITSQRLPDYPQKDDLSTITDTHYVTDTATVVGWLKDMPEALWNRGKEYGAVHYDLFQYGKEISNYAKLDSLGRFTLKIPLLNTSEVFMDWKHTFITTALEPGETYFLLYDFKDSTQMMMGKNSRLQNELLAHPVPVPFMYYKNMDSKTRTAQEHFDSLTPIYTKAMKQLKELSLAHPNLSKRYLDYVAGYEKCLYAQTLIAGSWYMKNADFPKEYTELVVKLWKEIKHPYTLYNNYDNLITDIVRQKFYNIYWLTDSGNRCLLNGTYYPQLLKKHQAMGDITISDQEIATVQLWQEKFKELVIKAWQPETKDPEKLNIAFSNSIVNKNAQKILARKDIVQMIAEEEPLLDIYYNIDIADSLNCNQDQHDIIVAKSFNAYMEQFLPLSDKGVELAKEQIKMKAARESVLGNHQNLVAIMNRDISHNPSLKTAPQDISDGEQLMHKILEPYKGKIVLLDVWGTWCSPCKEALRHSKEVFERLKPYDMAYIYMANNSKEEAWMNIIKQYNVLGDNVAHYNLLPIQQDAIQNYLSIHSFPSYRLFDQNGNLLDVPVDARNLDQLEKVIKSLSK